LESRNIFWNPRASVTRRLRIWFEVVMVMEVLRIAGNARWQRFFSFAPGDAGG
jgi:hypothetical protein